MALLDDPLALLTPEDLAALAQTKGDRWVTDGCRRKRWAFTRVGGCIRFTRDQAKAVIASLAEGDVAPVHVPRRDELAAKRNAALEGLAPSAQRAARKAARS